MKNRIFIGSINYKWAIFNSYASLPEGNYLYMGPSFHKMGDLLTSITGISGHNGDQPQRKGRFAGETTWMAVNLPKISSRSHMPHVWYIYLHFWLVGWNMFYVSIYWEE